MVLCTNFFVFSLDFLGSRIFVREGFFVEISVDLKRCCRIGEIAEI